MINRRRQAPSAVGQAGISSHSEAIRRLGGKAGEEASPEQTIKLPPISEPQNKLSTGKVGAQYYKLGASHSTNSVHKFKSNKNTGQSALHPEESQVASRPPPIPQNPY